MSFEEIKEWRSLKIGECNGNEWINLRGCWYCFFFWQDNRLRLQKADRLGPGSDHFLSSYVEVKNLWISTSTFNVFWWCGVYLRTGNTIRLWTNSYRILFAKKSGLSPPCSEPSPLNLDCMCLDFLLFLNLTRSLILIIVPGILHSVTSNMTKSRIMNFIKHEICRRRLRT